MTSDAVAIAGCLTSAQAEGVIASTSGEWTSRARRRIYYPYFWFHLRYATRTLLGKSSVRLSCLVDTRTGLASTADPFDVERLDPNAGALMEPRLAEDDALRIAHRHGAYVVRNGRKALSVPEVTVLERCQVYKPFWIVDGTKRRASTFRVLVDGLTGRFHVLRR